MQHVKYLALFTVASSINKVLFFPDCRIKDIC